MSRSYDLLVVRTIIAFFSQSNHIGKNGQYKISIVLAIYLYTARFASNEWIKWCATHTINNSILTDFQFWFTKYKIYKILKHDYHLIIIIMSLLFTFTTKLQCVNKLLQVINWWWTTCESLHSVTIVISHLSGVVCKLCNKREIDIGIII